MNYSMDELMPLVATLTEKYTSGESSSISYELAKQFMEAILYCIAELEKTEKMDIQLPASSTKLPAEEAYRQGYQRVIEKYLSTKAEFEALKLHFISYGNDAYADTVLKGMPVFFEGYDYNFCPQEHLLTLDYPVLQPLTTCGIDVISDYLQIISLEQVFLRGLPEHYVYETLTDYDTAYEHLIINLPEIVLQRILTTSLQDEIDELLLQGTLKEALYEELELLIRLKYDGDEKLLTYLKLVIPDIAVRIRVKTEQVVQ